MFDPPPAAHTAEVSKGHGSAWRPRAPVKSAGDPQFGGQKSAKIHRNVESNAIIVTNRAIIYQPTSKGHLSYHHLSS